MKFTNRIISVLLCILMLTAVTCIAVGATVVYVSGDWEYEKINNDTEFQVYAYNGSATTLTTFRSYNSLLITSIGTSAFEENTTLNKITFSSAVKNIQSYAFFNATALETVVCKSNLEFIDYSAFNGCTSLSSINLADTKITSVNYSTFMNCDSLTEVTLPETVTTINENAFGYCDNLAKITIPASVTEINEKAFNNTPNVVIYCYTDSAAHVFAETNAVEYVLLDAVVPTTPSEPETTETEPTEPTTPVETYILGDVDNDGDISVMDTTQVQMIIAQIIEGDDKTTLRGDIDRDDVLSIMDATSIQRYVASYDDGLHIGETFEV